MYIGLQFWFISLVLPMRLGRRALEQMSIIRFIVRRQETQEILSFIPCLCISARVSPRCPHSLLNMSWSLDNGTDRLHSASSVQLSWTKHKTGKTKGNPKLPPFICFPCPEFLGSDDSSPCPSSTFLPPQALLLSQPQTSSLFYSHIKPTVPQSDIANFRYLF